MDVIRGKGKKKDKEHEGKDRGTKEMGERVGHWEKIL